MIQSRSVWNLVFTCFRDVFCSVHLTSVRLDLLSPKTSGWTSRVKGQHRGRQDGLVGLLCAYVFYLILSGLRLCWSETETDGKRLPDFAEGPAGSAQHFLCRAGVKLFTPSAAIWELTLGVSGSLKIKTAKADAIKGVSLVLQSCPATSSLQPSDWVI